MTNTTRTGFDTRLDGREVFVEFDRTTTWSSGLEGQDADGNRGVWMTSIDEDYADSITLYWYDEGGDGHTDIPLAALTSLQALEVQRLVDEWLEQHEPTEPDEPEPDYDDVGD